MKKILALLLSLVISSLSQAQTLTQVVSPQNEGTQNSDTLLIAAIWIVIGVSILVLIVTIYALAVLRTILLRETSGKAAETSGAAGKSLLERINELFKGWTDAVPVEKEETVMLDHDYDGIRELDNHLPPWWKWLFYLSIVFAVVYLLAFHVFHIFPLSAEEYEQQMTRAKKELEVRKASLAASVDENSIEFTDDPSVLNAGKEIFDKNCVPCHASDGGGGVGPNLTDKYWIHGGSIHDIFRTIKYGVPEKGMITWQTQLSPVQIKDVACYVKTLEGTTPAKPKEPQGELYVPVDTTSVKADTTGLKTDTLKQASVSSPEEAEKSN